MLQENIEMRDKSTPKEFDKSTKLEDVPPTAPSSHTIADIVGEFGFYQLSITMIAFVRYVCVAMMTNTGSLIAPELDFSCIPDSALILMKPPVNLTMQEYLVGKCQLPLQNGTQYTCSNWTYNTTQHGVTLTDSFDLVCDRDWLRSAFQSIVSVGVMVASVIWGSFSDQHGRKMAINVSFIFSLITGVVSYFASNLLVYAVARSLCSFSDIGLVVSLTTIVVELLGNKYRGAVCIIVYTGWAIGVMIMPWLTEYFRDYRQLMLFTIMYHVLTLPWLMTTNESVRWLMINGRIDEALDELKRISWWNFKGDEASLEEVEKKFDKFKVKFIALSEKNLAKEGPKDKGKFQQILTSVFGGLYKVGELFQTRELTQTTITLIWTTFNCELLYMLFIMINSDIGDNVKLNYAIGGIMETIATFTSIIMISRISRKLSLVSTLICIAGLCLVFAFTHNHSLVSVWVLNITKLVISNLSSLVYVTTTEIFPTNLRQTGFGFLGTLGSFGAVVTPFIRTELVDLIGMTWVMILVVLLTSSAALLIPSFLRETKGVELSDDVDEILIQSEIIDIDLRSRVSSFSNQRPSVDSGVSKV